MNLQERIKLLVTLGNYLLSDDEKWQDIKERAERENAWFTKIFIDTAVNNIANHFLDEVLLNEWTLLYKIKDKPNSEKNIGVVMAGNIPLVGFHDFLCVFVSGYKQTIKPSSKDSILIKQMKIGRAHV